MTLESRWASLAAATRFAVLGTVRPDGTPHAVPIAHAVVDDVVLFAVDHKPKRDRNLRRLANIEHDPRVTVLFDHRSSDWEELWWVRADGIAEILDIAPPEAAALEERHPQYRMRPPEGPWVRITVHRWSGWSAKFQGRDERV